MDAGTLNCPDCGAAVPANATECSFCHARLATIGCEKCFGMVFVGSRHCQHCGASVKSPIDRDAAPLKCPRLCGEMRAVRFGGADMWECGKCSGLWVDRETVERLIAEHLKPAPMLGTGIPVPPPTPVQLQPVRYAPCPQCKKLMNRLNFAHTSGVIVDVCGLHGTWFDADELRRVLEFVAAGGLEAARAHELAHKQAQDPDFAPPEETFVKVVKPLIESKDGSTTLRVIMSYVSTRTKRK
jgi:Zn-finger nucleic acid-binding protein